MSTTTDRRTAIGLDELERRIMAMRASADRAPGLTSDILNAHASDLEDTLNYMRGIQR